LVICGQRCPNRVGSEYQQKEIEILRTILKGAGVALILGVGFAGVVGATPIIYPAKGQSADLQQRDQGECHGWAVQTTGIDPAQVAASAPPPPPPPQQQTSSTGGGERVRGAARGALGGAAIGAIAGDTGKGAGVGAVVGTMAGGRQARHNQAAANQQAQANHQAQVNQQAQSQKAKIDTYYRAYGACLEGRGYTVK
jgi:hypothetical protein